MGDEIVAILGTRYEDFSIEEHVLGPLGVTLTSGDGGSPEAIWAASDGAAVILAGSRPRFDAQVLAGLAGQNTVEGTVEGTLRGIVRYGVGTDSIDLDAARRHGIAVARVSDYGTEAVAFHSVSMALAQLRRLSDADRAVRSGSWGFADLRPMHEPARLTAGVVGYGRIGRRVASHLRGLGMRVSAYDAFTAVPASDGVRELDLVELLGSSDVVLLHAPGRADDRPLLDTAAFAHMRAGSVLVNTARGSLVDLPALVDGLRRGRPARAALDVYPAEPPDLSAFADVADRILFTPHMAWYTEESEADMRHKAAAEAARMLRGEPLTDPVVEGGERA